MYYKKAGSWLLILCYLLESCPCGPLGPSTHQSSQLLPWDFTNAKGKVQDDRSREMEEKAAEPIIKIIFKIISILNNVSKTMKKDQIF